MPGAEPEPETGVHFTLFPNRWAESKRFRSYPSIKHFAGACLATKAASKAELPFVKLAKFGPEPSERGLSAARSETLGLIRAPAGQAVLATASITARPPGRASDWRQCKDNVHRETTA